MRCICHSYVACAVYMPLLCGMCGVYATILCGIICHSIAATSYMTAPRVLPVQYSEAHHLSPAMCPPGFLAINPASASKQVCSWTSPISPVDHPAVASAGSTFYANFTESPFPMAQPYPPEYYQPGLNFWRPLPSTATPFSLSLVLFIHVHFRFIIWHKLFLTSSWVSQFQTIWHTSHLFSCSVCPSIKQDTCIILTLSPQTLLLLNLSMYVCACVLLLLLLWLCVECACTLAICFNEINVMFYHIYNYSMHVIYIIIVCMSYI